MGMSGETKSRSLTDSLTGYKAYMEDETLERIKIIDVRGNGAYRGTEPNFMVFSKR